MGIGPVNAIRGALQKAGLTLADMDLVEVRSVASVVGGVTRVPILNNLIPWRVSI